MTNPDSNQEAITQLTALKGQNDNESSAIATALKVLNNGYTSDQASIETRVTEGIAAGIQSATTTATDALTKQLVDLQASFDSQTDSIKQLTDQVTDLQTKLTEALSQEHDDEIEISDLESQEPPA